MRRLTATLTFVALWLLAPVRAQLASPNAMGVSMGHFHYVVRDMEPNRKFWIPFWRDAREDRNREALKLPEIFIFLYYGESSGGTEGSVVNHVAFRLPDISKALARFRSFGVRVLPQNPGSPIGNILTPEDERIQLFHYGTENVPFHLDGGRRDAGAERLSRRLTTPVSTHHFHLYLPKGQSQEAKARDVKTFGAVPGTRRSARCPPTGRGKRSYPAADLPGMNINFLDVDDKAVPTKGRMRRSHRVRGPGSEAFTRKLAANGVNWSSRIAGTQATRLPLRSWSTPGGPRSS